MEHKFKLNELKSQEEYDTLINFISNELKLLESVKSMITARINIDRQYAKDISTKTTLKAERTLEGFLLVNVINFIYCK